jgi:peptide/nickel transport system permease protein
LSTQSSVPLWLLRFKNFLVALLKNKLAAVGMVLLLAFVFLAVAAPVLTPYNKGGGSINGPVSAPFDPPTWVTLINGQIGYSQNSLFSAPSVNVSSSGVTVVQTDKTQSSVDLKITSQGQGGTINVIEKLTYPYTGPPRRVFGTASLTASGITENFTVTVFLQRVGETKYVFWPTTSISNGNYSPNATIDSNRGEFKDILHVGPSFSASEYLFAPRSANYEYIMQIVVPAGAPFAGEVHVTSLVLALWGNTWGFFGTDDHGYDIYTQLIYGSRLSLEIGLIATGIGIGVGLLVGLMAGYLGKLVDEVLMRFTDMLLVIPSLPLLIVLVATIGSSLVYIIAFLGFFGWMGFARVIRAQVLSLRERPFIEAAKASGAGTGYITVRHIFPNIVSLTYVSLALSVPAAIVGEAALSFLGLGDPTVVTWGEMLGNANSAGGSTSGLAWWWIIPPGFAIALISLSFVLLGYAMDEMFNPKLRRRR